MSADVSAWRENRDPGWHKDIGYVLQDTMRGHRYDYANKGAQPDDPGWHACSCGGWEGYWSGFEPHVADHLRVVATQMLANERERVARAIEDSGDGGISRASIIRLGALADAARIVREARDAG